MALRLMSRGKENEAKTDRTTEEKHELSSYAHSYDRIENRSNCPIIRIELQLVRVLYFLEEEE